MKKVLIFRLAVLALLMIGLSANAQLPFDFSGATTQNTETTHGTVLYSTTDSHQIVYSDAKTGYENKRVYKQLNSPLSDDCWSVKFKFTPWNDATNGYSDQPTDQLLVFTSNTSPIRFDSETDALSGTYNDQDFIGVYLRSPSGYYGGVGSDGITNGISSWWVGVYTKDGTNAAAPIMGASPYVALTTVNTAYYMLLERSGSTATLTVYSDASYTTIIGSSSHTFTGTISGLDYIQSGVNMEVGQSRKLSATIEDVLISPSCSCDFWDDYATNTGWTQVGGYISVNPSSSTNTCYFDGHYGATNNLMNTDQRVYKQIYSSGSLDDLSWKATCEFTIIDDTYNQEPGDFILAFTNGNLNPTNGVTSTNEDVIAVILWGAGSASQPISQWYLEMTTKDNTGSFLPGLGATSNRIFLLDGTVTYYLVFSRDKSTTDIIHLEVYLDAAHSSSALLGTASYTIASTRSITNLNYVQSFHTYTAGPQRHITATVDNLCIDDNNLGYHHATPMDANTISSNEAKANFNLYPNPNNGNMILEYNLPTNGKAIFSLTDITGKVLMNIPIENNSSRSNINLESFESGIYMYSVKVNNETVKTDKLILIK